MSYNQILGGTAMKKITAFIKDHQIYFFGFSVSFTTYFSAHAPKLDSMFELGLHIFSALLVGAFSWCYPIARVINGLF